MPFPATSPRRTPDTPLLRPFPVVVKYPQRANQLRVFQQRPHTSAWLPTTKIPAHDRCATPSFPFHSIPKSRPGEDKELNAAVGVGIQRECEDDLSLASLPSFSPLVPLPTTNLLCTANPFIDRRDSLSSDLDDNDRLNASYTGNSSGGGVTIQLNAYSELAASSLRLQDIGLGSQKYAGRRQFCACRDPCSDHELPEPSAHGISTLGCSKLKHISSPMGIGNPADRLARCHGFGAGPFADSPLGVRHEHLMDDPHSSSLNLIVPAPNQQSDLCTRNSWAPPTPGSAPHTDKTTVHPPPSFPRSEAYDTWVSYWRFQPSSQNVAAPGNLVPLSKSHVPPPPCTSLPGPSSLQVPVVGRIPSGESTLDGLGLLPPSSSVTVRNSCVLSGIDNLKSLRELLAILDDTMIKSGVATEPLGREEEGLPRPESEVVISGLAL